MADEVLLLRPEEVARALSISRSAVYRLISDGQIPSVRVGKSVRVPRVAIAEWLNARVALGGRGEASAAS
jgi:excisionase family DNA binding protein